MAMGKLEGAVVFIELLLVGLGVEGDGSNHKYKEGDRVPLYTPIKLGLFIIRVVWDLKQQKPVTRFSDSTRRRCSILQWNPDISTKLIVASDDDSSPSLRIYGMDAASGVAVMALNISPGDHILDLCAAPGSDEGFNRYVLNMYRGT